MADSVTQEITASRNDEQPYFGEVSTRKKRLLTRIFAALTTFLVFLAVVFCFVKGIHDHTMYLLAINLLLTSLIVGSMTWWYYSSVIPPERYYFVIFMALCLVFQSVVTDIFVWQKKVSLSKVERGGQISPTIAPPNISLNS